MTSVLAFPFRIDKASGQARTVEVGSDQEAREAIAMLAVVRLGERELCPGFGTPDPTYRDSIDISRAVQSGLVLWGPKGVKVAMQSMDLDPVTGIADVSLTFTIGSAA